MKTRKIVASSLTLTLALFLLALMASLTYAQGPAPQEETAPAGTAFTYQGRLRRGAEPVTATCQMAFQLYDAAAGGAAVGSPINAGVPVSDSLFTVGLDFGAAAFAGDARWLGIQVQCPGDAAATDLGRQALTAAPYALYAQGAPWSGLTGMPAGFADGTDDDTTYTAGTGLTLSGGAFSLSGSYQLPQECTSGYIPEWDGAAWVCGVDDVGSGGDGWALTGNAGTDPRGNFLGTTDLVTLVLRVNNVPVLRLVPHATSPNLIGGYSGNWVTPGAYGAAIGGGGVSGNLNRVTDNYGTVGGGRNNQAGNDAGSLTDGTYATVGGGGSNIAEGYAAAVGGGYDNIAGGDGATVGGGGWNGSASDGNETLAIASTIGGGYGNLITTTAEYATIGGGQYITASGLYATVGGGYGNIAGEGASVGGGGYYLDALGSYYNGNEALGSASAIGGGVGNRITTYADGATIGGGYDNTVNGVAATVGGGANNTTGPDFTTVGGGLRNTANGNGATISGGVENSTSDYNTTIPGGKQASADHYGQMAYASGGFNDVVGSAQASLYVMRRSMVMAAGSWNTLYLNGGNYILTIASGRTMTFDILVVGRTEAGESAGYQIQGVIENYGGTATLIGTSVVTVLGEDDTAWDAQVVVDTTHNALSVQVMGNGETIRWVATVQTAEVSW